MRSSNPSASVFWESEAEGQPSSKNHDVQTKRRNRPARVITGQQRIFSAIKKAPEGATAVMDVTVILLPLPMSTYAWMPKKGPDDTAPQVREHRPSRHLPRTHPDRPPSPPREVERHNVCVGRHISTLPTFTVQPRFTPIHGIYGLCMHVTYRNFSQKLPYGAQRRRRPKAAVFGVSIVSALIAD
jgi:hypothetical protein